MLTTKTIPQYGDDPEDWHRFLYKTCKGSVNAIDILTQADLAYMVDLTGDPKSPETLDLGYYKELFHNHFPVSPPATDAQQIINYSVKNNWIIHPFQVTKKYRNEPSYYKGIWARQIEIDWIALINDAALTCIEFWNSSEALRCIDIGDLDYDSRLVVSGMLYLSLTWPK